MGDQVRFEAWITKYALTKGIVKMHVEDRTVATGRVTEVGNPYSCVYFKSDWHRTREEAVAQAEKMRKAKLASLRKQIKKLEALSFS